MVEQANALAQQLKHETGKTLIGIRVFDNCLLCYFSNHSGRFVSKNGFNWGPVGSFYIPSINYSKETIPNKILDEFPNVIRWVEDYLQGNFITKWLMKFNRKQSYDL